MKNFERLKINKIQNNYLFTDEPIHTYTGKYGGPTWFVSQIKDIVFKDNNIHLIFASGLDVELELMHNKQEIFKLLRRMYF